MGHKTNPKRVAKSKKGATHATPRGKKYDGMTETQVLRAVAKDEAAGIGPQDDPKLLGTLEKVTQDDPNWDAKLSKLDGREGPSNTDAATDAAMGDIAAFDNTEIAQNLGGDDSLDDSDSDSVISTPLGDPAGEDL